MSKLNRKQPVAQIRINRGSSVKNRGKQTTVDIDKAKFLSLQKEMRIEAGLPPNPTPEELSVKPINEVFVPELPQSIAEDTVTSLVRAGNDDYVGFRADLKSTLEKVASTLRMMIEDLVDEITRIKNDSAWKDLSPGIRIKQLNALADGLNKIAVVERQFNIGGKRGQETPSGYRHNIPMDPHEVEKRLAEYDAILGRNILPAIPPGHQQRILIETKPVESVEEMNKEEEINLSTPPKRLEE